MNKAAAKDVLAAFEAVRLPFDGITVSVVSPRTLYLMKRDTVRPKDWSDAAALKHHFKIEG